MMDEATRTSSAERTADELIGPRRQLLIELERIIGRSCYNGHIQNYGPGGSWEGEGRRFRYPMALGPGRAVREGTVLDSVSNAELLGGHYAFGANRLGIMRALLDVVKHLEQNYGFQVGSDADAEQVVPPDARDPPAADARG